jgi:hypothetical protein
MKEPAESTYNDLAIASLVLGILSLTGMGPLTGIPAIITGWLALKKPGGRGMAIAGIVTGGVSILIGLLILLLIFLFIVLGLAAASQGDWHMPDDSYQQTPDSSFHQQRT